MANAKKVTWAWCNGGIVLRKDGGEDIKHKQNDELTDEELGILGKQLGSLADSGVIFDKNKAAAKAAQKKKEQDNIRKLIKEMYSK